MNYEQVPDIISSKDLDYLEDMFNYNYLGYKKIVNYIDMVNNLEIEEIMEKTRKMLGFAPEDYAIKIMNGKIAKCEDGKITINPELMQYKREIIEYVVAHEFCHLKYKSHGKRFYQIIEKYIPDYNKYEKEISEYEY